MMPDVSTPSHRSVLWITLGTLLVGCLSFAPWGHAGAMYRWVDAQGQIHLTDTPPPSTHDRPGLKVYVPSAPSPNAERQDTPATSAMEAPAPAPPPGGVVVNAELNRRLTVPLRLDTGAEVTVLTKNVAEALGMTTLDQFPTYPFHTAGGVVNFPVTSLRSLHVGSAEARDVNVAIDTQGQLPMGLLGQSFLRRFTMTVDPQNGQVTFAR
jgi:clan AA aspartic protease (TIGR02281 family)